MLDVELVCQPDVGRDAVLVHRLLQPVEVQLLELAPDVQRLVPAVEVERVEHELDVWADGLAHGGARLHVHLRVRGPRDGRHPGMQLDGLVAAPDAGLRELPVLVGSAQAARLLVAAHRARVGGHLVPESAQELVDRLAEMVARQVPERQVGRPDVAVEQIAVDPLGLLELRPDPLPVERVLAHQCWTDYALDEPRVCAEEVPLRALVRDHREHGLDRLVLGPRMRVPVRVARYPRHIGEGLYPYVDDTQSRPPMLARPRLYHRAGG